MTDGRSHCGKMLTWARSFSDPLACSSTLRTSRRIECESRARIGLELAEVVNRRPLRALITQAAPRCSRQGDPGFPVRGRDGTCSGKPME
ncbi:hypothetical protein BO99DRAFT_122840 [Aspergillus violaceofuscus CBS 115571]|uniref:Uncharacterized protein n=1 Tax=Aspergillus violaceofuscus (strain CBS 115571) TaxID=1450538 RepID=A0A2V5HHL4_ASPV1|nr:hypothetical protein BO99DRAFT_122840 [Aspergillus violaceofuscus CBS 115571]